jgi:thioredoxin-like negative regulator of GroEL
LEGVSPPRIRGKHVEERPELAKRFKVREVPTLVLVKEKRAVARLEGRANAAELEEFVGENLERAESGPPESS